MESNFLISFIWADYDYDAFSLHSFKNDHINIIRKHKSLQRYKQNKNLLTFSLRYQKILQDKTPSHANNTKDNPECRWSVKPEFTIHCLSTFVHQQIFTPYPIGT
ncbi:hypothetical protein CEXT_439781 [Caerostris extrusa]|uniref:Uncharacterized protein n=1 Tax=Caerostris extrusa TaxID=172846 RepID=A0AAV4Y1T3_CAEEX|nr:hypothetical protein CEXT_439781 [Caerostris extrusa]